MKSFVAPDKVDEKKMQRAERFIEKYLLKTFGTDSNGDSPIVEFTLIHRRKYQRLHYVPIPYWHKQFLDLEEEEAFEYIYSQAELNMNIAQGEFRSISSIFRDVRTKARKNHEQSNKG